MNGECERELSELRLQFADEVKKNAKLQDQIESALLLVKQNQELLAESAKWIDVQLQFLIRTARKLVDAHWKPDNENSGLDVGIDWLIARNHEMLELLIDAGDYLMDINNPGAVRVFKRTMELEGESKRHRP